MKNNAIRMEVKYILHSSFRQRRHSSFYIPLPSPFGEGLGGEASYLESSAFIVSFPG
jgi:hypothetical protein